MVSESSPPAPGSRAGAALTHHYNALSITDGRGLTMHGRAAARCGSGQCQLRKTGILR